jgi:large subunit ribosomal protein L13
MQTTKPIKKSEIVKNWIHIDADGKILGRLASEVSMILMGKHKATYVPYLNSGDGVIITNSKKIKVTGNKETDKKYYRHSGKVGGLKTDTVEKLREYDPNQILLNAVKGMLPKNRLRDVRLANLKLYPGAEHPHKGQVSQVEVKGE